MSLFSIRTLLGADLPAVLSIWNRTLLRDPITEDRFVRGILADADYWPGDDSGFFVATEKQQVIAFLRAIIRRMPNDRAGLETDLGWVPVVAVDPAHQRRGAGMSLVNAAIDYFRRHNRKRLWACGNSGSAPGYVFPGVDVDAYPGGLRLLQKAGFRIDRHSVAMSRGIIDFDLDGYYRAAWQTGPDVRVQPLAAELVQNFFDFLADAFPGDWNTAARMKVRAGLLHEILIATVDGRVVGYCQWEGEHFGPFGVHAEFRDRKIGAKLFVEAVRRIREADGRSVWFNWAEDDAARFYRRFGLEATRQFAILTMTL